MENSQALIHDLGRCNSYKVEDEDYQSIETWKIAKVW